MSEGDGGEDGTRKRSVGGRGRGGWEGEGEEGGRERERGAKEYEEGNGEKCDRYKLEREQLLNISCA